MEGTISYITIYIDLCVRKLTYAYMSTIVLCIFHDYYNITESEINFEIGVYVILVIYVNEKNNLRCRQISIYVDFIIG